MAMRMPKVWVKREVVRNEEERQSDAFSFGRYPGDAAAGTGGGDIASRLIDRYGRC